MKKEKFKNPPDDQINNLLLRVRTIAVVGLSPNSERPSYQVAKRLRTFGYKIIPVRIAVDSIMGEKAYPDLRSVPDKIDLVDVFRAPQYVEAIVDDCMDLWLPALWLQQGVINDSAAIRARLSGIDVVMDKCISQEYINCFGENFRLPRT
jgi:predicted CoA-binding protein